MKRYEYMTADLSAEPSFNVHTKLIRYIEKLNEYGKQGWRLISGTDDWKYSIFEREIEDHEEKQVIPADTYPAPRRNKTERANTKALSVFYTVIKHAFYLISQIIHPSTQG